MIKKSFFSVFIILLICVNSLYADFYVTEMKSFSTKLNSSGQITEYNISVELVNSGTNNRNICILFVPEQYESTLNADTRFRGGSYYLSGDTNTESGAIEFPISNYGGIVSNTINQTFQNNNSIRQTITLKFTSLAGTLDPAKSYAVYFVLRTRNSGCTIFYNSSGTKSIGKKLLPIEITLNKVNPDTRQFGENKIYTHVIEGSDISFDTWPASEIAGDGYKINENNSSGSGTVVAQEGVGSVDQSNRKAQNLVIKYDLDDYTVTLNPMGGTIDKQSIKVYNTGHVPETSDVTPVKEWYTFDGWSTDQNATTVNWTSSTQIKADTDLYAVWHHDHAMNIYSDLNTIYAQCRMPGCEYDISPIALTPISNGIRINPVVVPSDATNKNLLFSVSEANIATVYSNGSVIADKEGSTTITAQSTDGSGKVAVYNLVVGNSQ